MLARHSFRYYLHHAVGLKPYPHIQRIIDLLEGPEQQVCIVMPPGHGKSTIISQNWPSWYLGNHPDRSMLLISTTDALAKSFFDTNKQTFEHLSAWKETFPDVRPAHSRGWSQRGLFLQWRRDPATGMLLPNWTTKDARDKDPSLFATGIGGPVIGRRADVIVVDDPYDEEMARSEQMRTSFLDWFRRTLLSRLKPVPHAKVVVALTRWHPDDCVAWMQDQNRLEALDAPARPPDTSASTAAPPPDAPPSPSPSVVVLE